MQLEKLSDAVTFLRDQAWAIKTVPEYVRFIRLCFTIPGSSCTNERCFSVLRRLKDYLRSIMGQIRLNDIAILNLYDEFVDTLDLEALMDKLIYIQKFKT